eukprot:GHVU01187067.1.p1 GENE.GHVU01187067.1~~GHVU01187067.1.p1  ORF type:complete len:405 (+),score=75.88 GHVU01187067.1:1082-2296(+)
MAGPLATGGSFLTVGLAKFGAESPFELVKLSRRALGPADVHVEIDYCGICHSDILEARGLWGGTDYPIIPGHEIVGRVIRRGPDAANEFGEGAVVGVGCFVDSCRTCSSCVAGMECYCLSKPVDTYNSRLRFSDDSPTFGGYARDIVVDKRFVVSIPAGLVQQSQQQQQPTQLQRVAPLLCAGTTVFSALKHWKLLGRDGASSRPPQAAVGVLGFGGLGSVAVKIAKAMGHRVTVFSSKEVKRTTALDVYKADAFVLVTDPDAMRAAEGTQKFILDTLPCRRNVGENMKLLCVGGTLCLLGAPGEADSRFLVDAGDFITSRKTVTGSLVGGVGETKEMLLFCEREGVLADVESVAITQVDEAHERVVRGDVKFRFVIDVKGTCPGVDALPTDAREVGASEAAAS